MSETLSEVKETASMEPVNVFTHGSDDPGSWTEEEVDVLLDIWIDVLDQARFPKRRYDITYKVFKRLSRRKGFVGLTKEDVWQQMDTLYKEYTTCLGLEKSVKNVVKAKCMDKLEKIFGNAAIDRKMRARSVSAASEESDGEHSVSRRVSESGAEDRPTKNSLPDSTIDKEVGQRRRRTPRGVNIRRLLRQQQDLLSEIQKGAKLKEDSEDKVLEYLTKMVDLQKVCNDTQNKMIECLKNIKV